MRNLPSIPLTIVVGVIITGCATDGTAPFFVDGRESTIRQDPHVIIQKRAGQKFPLSLSTFVPERLQPLALDFAAFFAGSSDKTCGNYKVQSIVKLTPASEAWTIDSCGTAFTYEVSLASCNDLMNSPLLVVRRPSDGRTLAGANPLDATFIVACPDRKP
jgi:hypothetical protein